MGQESICTFADAIHAANTNSERGSCAAGSDGEADVINLTGDIVFTKEDPGQFGNALPFIRSDIIIEGNNHTLSRDLDSADEFRLTAVSTAGAHLTINNLTFTGGRLTNFNGGALFISSTTELTLNNVILDDNQVRRQDGDAVVQGGAIFSQGRVTINNSTISNNMALRGIGGGISGSRSTIILSDSVVSSNVATNSGGGIFGSAGTVTLTNSIVSGNTVTSGNGGGILAQLFVSITLTNSTVSGNTTGTTGGGIFTQSPGPINLINSTVSNNSAGSGGGIDASAGMITLTNSLIVGNHAITEVSEARVSGGTITANNSLFGHSANSNQEAFSGEVLTEILLDSSNIIATRDGTDPTALSNILQPLGNNGGNTRTHALAAASPARNAAISNACPYEDQRGQMRDKSDGYCDIGAFEFNPNDDIGGFVVIPLANGRVVVIPN